MTSTDQSLLFISDVHLGGFSKAENERIESDLIKLLDYSEQHPYRLCILGDLFDYWMEYPHYIPTLGKRLLERFKCYHRNVGPSLFITGNHDNWTRGYFEELGFDVERNYRALSLNAQRVLLMHGDGLITSDRDVVRPPMHRLLRNPSFIRLYQRMLPPKTGLRLMKYFSRANRMMEEYRSNKKRLNKWAESWLKQTETDVVICGHDHWPRAIEFDFGTFINLGTFYKHKTLAVYNKGQFSLVVWNNVAGDLEPFNSENTTS